MSTSTKKALLLHQQRECLYYKRSEGLFLQNTNYKYRYQLYKEVLRNKIYIKKENNKDDHILQAFRF